MSHFQNRFSRPRGPLVRRHAPVTRLTHWLWVICFAFLLPSGLQIFIAHPARYWGNESGFSYDNAILQIRAVDGPAGPQGETDILGHRFDTTGVLGLSGPDNRQQVRAIPTWATIPSYRDLGTGRVIHFFFAWLLVATLALWLLGSLLNRHLWRDIWPRLTDLRRLPQDIWDHLRLLLHHVAQYGPLQKISYVTVLGVLFPLMILTGLSMSPTLNAAWPWLPELFGGRQSARSLHFLTALLLLGFLIVHLLMVLMAGPVNEIRSMLTGWYRTDPLSPPQRDEKP